VSRMFVVDCSYVSTISLYMYLNTPSSMTSLLQLTSLGRQSKSTGLAPAAYCA
jgi:hypothetical protein